MHGYELIQQKELLLISDILAIQKIIEPDRHGIRTLP